LFTCGNGVVKVQRIDRVRPDARGVGRHQKGTLLASTISAATSVGSSLHKPRRAVALGFGELRLTTNALCVENIRFYERRGHAIERRDPFLGGEVVLVRVPTSVKAPPDGGQTRCTLAWHRSSTLSGL
jgi:hypothetical protein